MTPTVGDAAHWDSAYGEGETTRSWFQQHAELSLQLMAATGVSAADSVIDVGGGASTLVDGLLDRGRTDVTVLDISAEGLLTAQSRLGSRATLVHWLVADLLTWTPDRTWQVWHDRAVLQFFTADADRARYLRALHSATAPGSYALLATFAPDGPTHCSGLPVARYSGAELAALVGQSWELLSTDTQEHTTPAGHPQPFTWTAFRRLA
jgi:trans-aconitate methyltransferase